MTFPGTARAAGIKGETLFAPRLPPPASRTPCRLPPADRHQPSAIASSTITPPSTLSPGFMIGPGVSKRVRSSAYCTATTNERTVTRHLTFPAPLPPTQKSERARDPDGGWIYGLSLPPSFYKKKRPWTNVVEQGGAAREAHATQPMLTKEAAQFTSV